jgi:hypothetical protein
VNLGFIPKLTEILDIENDEIRREAAWILTNIAASQSNYVELIRNANCTYKLIALLSSKNIPLKEQVFYFIKILY